jgi:hypothetical protein
MEKQPYYFELEDQLKMFLSAIDGCVVKRYNKDRISADEIRVRYVYASKQRALHDLVNKAQHITLPVVAYWVKSVTLDTKRVFNKIDGYDQVINGTLKHVPQPLPVKIELELSFLTKFQADIDQIISNLFVYFQPYIVISWNRFGLPWHEIRSKVLWSGNINLTYPVDINDNQPTRVTGDTSFTIEGWIFKEDVNSAGEVRTIEATFAAISSISNNIDDLNAQLIDNDSTETFTISGNPTLVSVYPYNVMTGTEYDVTVYGNFLRGISAAYLSSSDVYPALSSTLVDVFSASPTLSADNPPFYGFQVDFSINSENSITVNIPPPLSAGHVDVVFVNRVGYGKLTDDTTSPYASGITVFES